MSLRFAVLGLLRTEPMSGYDLKTRWFDRSIAHFWPADQSQIYRLLDDLVKTGHATYELAPPAQGPQRKIYTITDEGQSALDAWLHDSPEPPLVRDASLVNLFFGHWVGKETTQQHLERLLAAYDARLESYEAIPLPPLDQCANRIEMHHRMTLELGLAHAKAGRDWAKHCLAAL